MTRLQNKVTLKASLNIKEILNVQKYMHIKINKRELPSEHNSCSSI